MSYSETGDEVNVFKGIELGSGTYTGSTSWPRNCSYVSSKVFCVRTSVFPAINEKTLPNTVRQISIDACRSAGAKGLRSLVYPASMVSLEAYEQSSTDPYLNPNIDISLEHARLYEDRGRSEGSNEK